MIYGWNKFKGWVVLEYFLGRNKKIHVNGLAKDLKISSSTAQAYLSEYEKEGILEREKTANIIIYKLKETPFTLELKKLFTISKILPFAEQFQKENQYMNTLALYGSHAKGTYDEKSDFDLLAISQQKKISLSALKKLEEKTGKEVRIQVFTRTEWKNLLKKNDNFAFAVLKNNILLAGEPL